MKTKECLKKSMRLVAISLRKATSYKVVKGRLGNRFYSDEFLQARLSESKHKEELADVG
jgi:hypothetical protein